MKESLLNILPLTDGFHYYVTYKAGNYVVQVAKYSNLDFGKVEMVSFGENPKSDVVSYEIGFRKLEEHIKETGFDLNNTDIISFVRDLARKAIGKEMHKRLLDRGVDVSIGDDVLYILPEIYAPKAVCYGRVVEIYPEYIEHDSSIHYIIKCEDIDSPIGYLGERILSDWDFKNGIVWKTFEEYKNGKVARWPIKAMEIAEVDEWLDNWEKKHLSVIEKVELETPFWVGDTVYSVIATENDSGDGSTKYSVRCGIVVGITYSTINQGITVYNVKDRENQMCHIATSNEFTKNARFAESIKNKLVKIAKAWDTECKEADMGNEYSMGCDKEYGIFKVCIDNKTDINKWHTVIKHRDNPTIHIGINQYGTAVVR